MVKYDPLPAANVNTFFIIAVGWSLTDLVERTVHSLATTCAVAPLDTKLLTSYGRDENMA
jgi:hypothetical protein